MASTTDPTVPIPTATDTDDDDDDDDVSSSLLPSQSPAATPPSAQPTVASAPVPPPTETAIPGVSGAAPAPTTAPSASGLASILSSILPSSATELADSLPSSSPTSLTPTTPANDGNGSRGGLNIDTSAGIGIGVALNVCRAAFGTWFFMRHHKAHRNKTRSTSSHSPDEEHAQKPPKSEVYAYRSGGPAEVSSDEKPRRWSELESPTYVAEVGYGQVFRAELPGSAVSVAAAGKGGDERSFVDAPIDVQERTVDKKDGRLFSDPPIDEGTDTLDVESKSVEKKG
ncbi:hypothetical protein BU25DRAFT_185493 [Macroventuria anomochaeta]|uniref:Uncharacterized protein n=1 Tax=Macroventuria anomochaeta TaxID=301207 RepID=A0ACB6SAS3_9PLEO|nr:uncharacterized protein BU25DRAFT_185493 [Macroventuria anomochaeta]KAF2631401.1 hypothetical protein BU25DRAFT_185493 [Macroventuria anomochaeta]